MKRGRGSTNSDAETQTGNEPVAEALKQLPHKLDLVVTAIQNMTNELIQTLQQQSELTRRHMQDLYEESKTEREDQKELIDTLSKQTQETIEVCTTRIATTMIEVMQNTNNKASTDKEISEAKNNISYLWKNRAVVRKMQYWHFFRNKKLYDTYSIELTKETPKMPRKFQPVRIENEPPEEFEVRKELAISKLTNEIKLLKIRYERHQKHFEEVDLEIENILKSKFEENVSSILCSEWKSDCKKEEETSARRFYRSEEWFHENLTNEPRPSQIERSSTQRKASNNYNNRNNEVSTAWNKQ